MAKVNDCPMPNIHRWIDYSSAVDERYSVCGSACHSSFHGVSVVYDIWINLVPVFRIHN
jgi:hypothetical protein